MKRSVSMLSLALAALATGCDTPVLTPAPVQTGSTSGGGYIYGNARGYDSAPGFAPLPPLTLDPAAPGLPAAAGFTGPTGLPIAGGNMGATTLAPIDPMNDLTGIYIQEVPSQVMPDADQGVAEPAVLGDAVAATRVENSATPQATSAPSGAQVAQIAPPQVIYEPVYVPEYYPVMMYAPPVVMVEPQYIFYPVYEPIFIERRREICFGVVIHQRDDWREARPLRPVPHAPWNPQVAILPPSRPPETPPFVKPSGGGRPLGPPPGVPRGGSPTIVQTGNSLNHLPVFTSGGSQAGRNGGAAALRNDVAGTPVITPNPAVTPAKPVASRQPAAIKPPVVVTPAAQEGSSRVVIMPAPKAATPVIAPLPKVEPAAAPDRRPAPGNAPAKMPAIRAAETPSQPPPEVAAPARVPAAPRPMPVAAPAAVIHSSPALVRMPDSVVAAPAPVHVSAPAPAPEPAHTSNAPSKLPVLDSSDKKAGK